MIAIIRSHFGELLSYNCNEFFITDSSISVFISIINHLINFCCWEIFTNTCCDSFKIFRSKGSSSIRIKYFVEWLEGWFRDSISRNSKDFKEESKVNLFRWCCRGNNLDNLFSLVFKSKSFNSVDELFRWNVSTVIVVKYIKAFFHLHNIIFFKSLSSILLWIKTLNYINYTLLISFRYD